jgi:hypothetical protein
MVRKKGYKGDKLNRYRIDDETIGLPLDNNKFFRTYGAIKVV